jgi:hypothetical protein
MSSRISRYSPRERKPGERKPISGAQRRRLQRGMAAGDLVD